MGRYKLIETPEELWSMFEEYANETKSRVRNIQKATNKGVLVEGHTPPLTLEGFEVFCLNKGKDCHHYMDNTENRYAEYGTIVTHIKKCIRQDQLEGALVGEFQQNIVARMTGLTEKTDVTTNGKDLNEVKVTIVTNGDKGNDNLSA